MNGPFGSYAQNDLAQELLDGTSQLPRGSKTPGYRDNQQNPGNNPQEEMTKAPSGRSYPTQTKDSSI